MIVDTFREMDFACVCEYGLDNIDVHNFKVF